MDALAPGPLSVRVLLSRLRKVRKSGAGWVACCPAHDDAEPSLSVSEGDDGRVLFHCHRGCSFEAVAGALDLPAAALMGAAAGDGSHEDRPAVKPTAEDYDYTDEAGAVLFRVSRYYKRGADGEWKKHFVQRRPDGVGGFTTGRGDAPLVLYNLPAVRAAAAAGEPVYVVEGEKDVHTLRAWGLVGTCNAGGAGKWDPAYGPALAGADVVVVPDNDEPGRRHAADVAASARAHAASVVVVDLPGLADKGDLSDWARLGHTRDELRALVARVREAAPALADDVDLGPVRRPLVGLSEVAPEAVRGLPELLRQLCGHYPAGIERTVALTSALAVLSGLLPNVRVAHYDKPYGLHLMHCLVARSGGGKGVLDDVARLGSRVDAAVRREAQWAIEDWERERAARKRGDTSALRPRPFPAAYFVPANASKAYILRAVEAAGEAACMVETEIDTLVGANAQEWGDFTDLIRKAFHHEAYRVGRVGAGDGEALVIERPSLAVAVSGTWTQFERLFAAGVENGFFNRFCFVVSNVGRRYRSQRPTAETWRRESWYAEAAVEVESLYTALRARTAPLVLHVTEAGWDRIDATYGPAYARAAEGPLADRALPFVQRSALMAVRLAGVLTVLRAWDHRVDLAAAPPLCATGHDVALAVHIASVWYEHGAALLSHLSAAQGDSPLVAMTDEARAVYGALPPTFKKAAAVAAGETAGVSERTVKRYLQQYQAAGLLLRDGHTYTKVEAAAEAVAFQPDIADPAGGEVAR